MSAGTPSNGITAEINFEDSQQEQKHPVPSSPSSSPKSSLSYKKAHTNCCPLHSYQVSTIENVDAMTVNNVARGDGVSEETRKVHNSAAAPEEESSTKAFALLAVIFLSALVVLALVYSSAPKLDEEEYQYIKVPWNLEDAKNLARVLSRYKDKYFYQVLFAFFIIYIFLQTFAIPGSIFLSIISGFLYPFMLALPVVCLCSGIGASLCYLLSSISLNRLARKYLHNKISQWRKQVDHHRDHLLNYILFLRITPFLPNWFINVTSPIVNVGLWPFFIGTVIGVAPPSFVLIQAGTTLHKLTSYGEPFTWGYFGLLGVFAVVSLLPVLFKERLRKKLE